tara:strand:+ start:801 stop:1166 length:366 start_codon:yes stop_codon:yes gene_type:complete
MPIIITPTKKKSNKKKKSKQGIEGQNKTKDMLAIKPKKDLKYKRNYSYGEHYDKAFTKTFGKMPKKPTMTDKIAKGVGMVLSPTVAMEAAYNNYKNKQYKAHGGKISKYYKDGGMVITGRD